MTILDSNHRGSQSHFRREPRNKDHLDAVKSADVPDSDDCLQSARRHEKAGNYAQACEWLCRIVDSTESFLPWQSASALLERILRNYTPPAKRTSKLAVLGSYTTAQFVGMLRLAALREGILLSIYEAEFGQFRQEMLDAHSGMYEFDPDLVLIATHAGELSLPAHVAAPDVAIENELERWTSLWRSVASRSKARIVMHNIAIPPENALGHLSARLPGSRSAMMQHLNSRLGEAAGSHASIVDCDRVAALFGKRRWFDDRYWHLSKQAVALDALPLLARHTVAVFAADLGLSKKCLLLDLDNTLWGGVIGEDGLAGIKVGPGSPEGEAYLAFQRYLLELKSKGVVLAVCSKNNESDAREVFERHPDMALKLDDFAMFVANWDRKPDNIRRIAATLNIATDSMVFVDDNPCERELIRRLVPDVDVIALPADPKEYVRALSEYLMFETSSLTPEDAEKTRQYRAKAQIAQLESSAESIEDFYASLQMQAEVAPFDELHLPRIVQLIGKTNQFNLTTKRHTAAAIRGFMADPGCVHLYLKLRDRFADHGLVSVIIARQRGDALDIDTWLMSCRVIGRTVEAELLSHLCQEAPRLGCARIRGTYVPTAKNAMVKDIFSTFGFVRQTTAGCDGATQWEYDLAASGPITNGFIEGVQDHRSANRDDSE